MRASTSAAEARRSDLPDVHPVHRALNKPLTIWGVDRRLFFLTAIVSAATFNLFASLRGGALMFVVLYTFFRRVTRTDPELLGILLRSSGLRAVYDPGKTTTTTCLGRRVRA